MRHGWLRDMERSAEPGTALEGLGAAHGLLGSRLVAAARAAAAMHLAQSVRGPELRGSAGDAPEAALGLGGVAPGISTKL